MKYVVIIPDGAADLPIADLDGLTPFEAADTPHLDAMARLGRVGTAETTPPGFQAGSDVCSMSLLGYDPARYHTGRAPLEAAALGVRPGADAWIFRVNLVTVGAGEGEDAGRMLDHSAGAIPDAEARVLLEDLGAAWQREAPEIGVGVSLTPGVSYRNIMVDGSGRDYGAVVTTPPHEIPGERWDRHLPAGGEAAEALCRLIEIGAGVLGEHEVNRARREQGLRPANMAWIWGQGTPGDLPSFEGRFGVRGAMITSVDLLAGIAALIGWDRLDVPGLTSFHDTDYRAQGRATVEAVDRYDLVCTHVEAPDEASHQADWQTKVASLESIDREIVGPVVEKLRTFGDPELEPYAVGWRLLVMPDHYTLVSTRRHDPTPVPLAIAGSWVRSVVARVLTEVEADRSDLHVARGHELMEYFLRAGLNERRARGNGGRDG